MKKRTKYIYVTDDLALNWYLFISYSFPQQPHHRPPLFKQHPNPFLGQRKVGAAGRADTSCTEL